MHEPNRHLQTQRRIVHERAASGHGGGACADTAAPDQDSSVASDARDAASASSSLLDTRLALALEAGRMGVWEWSVPRGTVAWSSAIEEMHGIPVGSFEGTLEAHQRDLHPEDRERVLATIRRSVSEQSDQHHLTYRIVRPDGQVRWLEASGRVLRDAMGNAERVVGVCRDVTERVEAEAVRTALATELARRQEAEAARKRIETILEGITDLFTVYDRSFRVVFANAESTKLLGITPAQALGKTPWELMPGMADSTFRRALVRAMEAQVTTSITDYCAPLDRWFEVRMYPLGELGVAAYGRDVTAARKQEMLLTRLRRYGEIRAEVSAALARTSEIRDMLQACCDRVRRSYATCWRPSAYAC